MLGQDLIAKWTARWHSPTIADKAALREFLGQRAAFISQKCTIEYCRARAGLMWTMLFAEEPFQKGLQVSQWEAFAAVLIDCGVLMENRLRPHLDDRPQAGLAEVLAELIEDRLTYHPTPAHRPDGWGDVVEEARRRLRLAQLAAPKPAHEIGKVSAQRVFETLPLHPSVRSYDFELVQNNIRMNLARTSDDFTRFGRPEPLLDSLLPTPDER